MISSAGRGAGRASGALARAEALRAEGRLAEAEAACRQALAAEPDRADGLHLMAIVAHQSGRIQDAIENASRAVVLAPDEPLYAANLGEMWRLAGRRDLALQYAQKAIELDPRHLQGHLNAAAAHYERNDYAAAIEHARSAIAIDPGCAQAHSSLGNAFYGLRRFGEAADAYTSAVELGSDFADAWSNLGTALHRIGRYDDAALALRRAIAIDPASANAHSGLGILLLMRGDFAEGWEEYEWRLKSTEPRLPYLPHRPWRGESLAGRRIYIHGEQGFGDTLQFARYLPRLAARGAAVTFRVQQGLLGLLRTSLPAIEVVGDRDGPTAVEADVECALLSLPGLFGTRLETIPALTPYLRADEAASARWRARLAGSGLKVGIAWAGNPQHANDGRRSIDLAELAPILGVPGVTFVSLQVGPRAADLSKAGAPPITDVAGELVGFADTAALMSALDLVITVDSAVAHLAGALARPVWLLTPWVSDWRWLLGRTDSPWYPTMRLFRQTGGQTWRDIAEAVSVELTAAAGGDASRLTPFRDAGEARARAAAAIIAAQDRTLAAPGPPPMAGSPAQMLAIAEQRQRAGELAEADLIARRLLEADPAFAEAHHLRGIVAHQSGNLMHAIEHVARAVELAPETPLFHANLGEMLRLAGRLDEAATEAESAIALRPDYADAHSNLGIIRFERGDVAGALESYDRAIALRPDFVQALSNRGNALRALKRLDEAVVTYRAALDLKSDYPEAWNNLGTTLRDVKRLDEAVDAYRRALSFKPDDPNVLNSLALALKDLGLAAEAEATLRRSLSIAPGKAMTNLYLGVTLLDARRVADARPHIDEALRLEPQNPDVLNVMGRLMAELGDLEPALGWFRRALDQKPDLADALNNMGNALKELGRIAEAEAVFVRSLSIDPTCIGAWFNFADGHHFTPGDPRLAAMEALAAEPTRLSATERLQLDFALGKAYADLQDYPRSFRSLSRGAAAKRAIVAYDEDAALGLFDRIEKIFTRRRLASMNAGGSASPVPIFIIGMPRSGSSLVEQILASHPSVYGAGELTLLRDVVQAARPDGAAPAFPELVPLLDAPAIEALAGAYLAGLQATAPGAGRITDKMPSNYYYAGLIHLAFPHAAIIHTVRDPLDTCVSCYSKLFSGEQNHTYDLAELGRYYRGYERLMGHWRRVLPPGRIHDLNYEALIADFEGEARRLVDYCGLDWDERCLRFHDTERAVRTASAAQVREPVFDRSIGRWRAYADFLGPLREALG